MRRHHVRYLALLLGALLLSACGGGSDDGDAAVEAPTTQSDVTDAPTGTESPPETADTSGDEDATETEGEAAGTQEPVTITFGEQTSPTRLAYWSAIEEGFFEDEGITIDQVQMGGATGDIFAAMFGGSVDAVQTTIFSLVQANQASGDLGVIGVTGGALQLWDIQFVAANGVDDVPAVGEDGATWEDVVRSLEGKTVGMTAIGSNFYQITRYLLAEVGLDIETDVDVVEVGLGGPAIAALQAGQVDITMTQTAQVLVVEDQGFGRLVLDLGVDGPSEMVDQPFQLHALRAGLIEDHPDIAERYSRALDRGVEFVREEANHAQVIEYAVLNGLVEEGQASQDLEVLLGELAQWFEGVVPCEGVQVGVDWSYEAGIVEEPESGQRLTASDITAETICP